MLVFKRLINTVMDYIGTMGSVPTMEVSLFQSVLIREVPLYMNAEKSTKQGRHYIPVILIFLHTIPTSSVPFMCFIGDAVIECIFIECWIKYSVAKDVILKEYIM